MTRTEQLYFLIHELMPTAAIPKRDADRWTMFRTLVNLREPGPVSEAFLQVQDDFLKAEIAAKGITQLADLQPIRDGIYLWQGDSTTLAVDAIVNAANSGLTGCYCPCHRCLDNAVHTFAGVQLRNDCARLMAAQNHEEPVGQAKITPAYNLPSRFVLHTVGPLVSGRLTNRHRAQLAACYRACLDLAVRNRLNSVAFCCISTGEFHFPNEEAAQIAVHTIRDYQRQSAAKLNIVFDVFKTEDWNTYQRLLLAE